VAGAVYLGALWLRDGPEPVAAVQRLALEADHVAEYVAAEVLDGLEPALRRFLLRSSSLDPVSGPLCDDALPSEGSGELLARLQRQSLLVTRVRGRPGWFAYHALFRELLRAQLDETEPGAAAAIQRRATQWCVDHGLAEEAAAYAIGAGDLTALAGLLDQHYPRLLRSGHTETVARWIRAFPEDGLRERPAVVVAMAWAEFIAGAPAARLRRLLALAHDGRTRQPGSWSPSLEVPWLLLTGLTTSDGVQASITAIAAALDLARTERPDLVPGALGALAHVHELAGDFEQAQADALAAIEHPTASRRLYGIPSAMGTLALIDCARDRVASAREHLDAARKLVRESGAEDSPTGARLHTIDAVVSLTEQRYSHAERAAQRGLNQAFYSDIGHAWALLVLADVRVRRGRIAAAKQPLGHALEILAATPDAGRLTVFAAEVQEAARATEANLRRPAEPLSPAELAVVRLLPAMPTSRELAASLVLSPNTVKSQLRAIYRKLGVSSRADALARAVELGLIDRAEPEVATPNEPALDRRERAR
jgi:LuxR family maltose regulon positive regulatory protein